MAPVDVAACVGLCRPVLIPAVCSAAIRFAMLPDTGLFEAAGLRDRSGLDAADD